MANQTTSETRQGGVVMRRAHLDASSDVIDVGSTR